MLSEIDRLLEELEQFLREESSEDRFGVQNIETERLENWLKRKKIEKSRLDEEY